MQAFEEIGSRIEAERRQIEQMHAQWESWNEDRLSSLEGLAKHYLPELSDEAIEQTWGEVRHDLQQVQLRKQDEQRQLVEQRRADETLRRGLEKEFLALEEELERVRQQADELTREVENALRQDESFVRGTEQAAMAEAALERAEANLEEVSQDAARKLPAYESCRFFRYLNERQFGTPAYRSKGLTRRVDRMLADFCDYRQANRNYQFLTETPETMRRIIAEDREALHTVVDQLHSIRDRIADQHGLPEQLERLQELERKREPLLEDLEAASQRTAEVAAAETQLEGRQGPFYEEAVQIFRRFLQQSDPETLRDRAMETPEIRDDQIVATLRGLDDRLGQSREDAASRRDSVESLHATQAAVGRLLQRFRASGFDSSGRCFPEDLDIPGRLATASRPEQVEELWQLLRRQQRSGVPLSNHGDGASTPPMAQGLANTMADAAAGEMSQHARRAGTRRRSPRRD